MKIYKYSGAGNDFVLLDGRTEDCSAYTREQAVVSLCSEYSTDGLMVLGAGDEQVDFTMDYYNSDGSGGMMCGNGGRCIAAFADYLGIAPSHAEALVFRAADGLHTASVLSSEGSLKVIRLKMIPVEGIEELLGGRFLNTGTRHFVLFSDDVDREDVDTRGRDFRHRPQFAPVGTNVNFVQVCDGFLKVRTFEKGVEAETLACGTGIVASAISAFDAGVAPSRREGGAVVYDIISRRGDRLAVDFIPGAKAHAGEVYLTGPAELIWIKDI
ncbi:MAG: diaminopimelate epimerase [Bacteroidales bacterium]|nr:diaminopimelate epimerase [Bacteroidales bacterium]